MKVVVAVLTLSPGCAIAFADLEVYVKKVTSSDEIACDAKYVGGSFF